LSIQRLELKLEGVVSAIDQGYVPFVREADDNASDGDDEIISATLSLEFFEAVRLRKAVHEDLLEVRSLLALTNDLNQDSDAKLQRLLEFLDSRPPNAHKTIVFTQFGDTAEYLSEALRTKGYQLQVAKGGDSRAMSFARR